MGRRSRGGGNATVAARGGGAGCQANQGRKANLSSLRRSGRAGDVAAGRAEVAGPRPGHVCAEVCGGERAGAGWGAGEVSLSEHMHVWFGTDLVRMPAHCRIY